MPEWRNIVCGAMIVILPASLSARDSSRAILHSDGATRLNGNPAPNSSAIFPHDLVQTPPGHTATIDMAGSTVTVQPDSVVQFDGDELVLDHGSLQLKTSRQLKVRVNCIRVIPIIPDWTQYEVTDVDGRVTVAAYQKDVKIHSQDPHLRQSKQSENSDAIVHQGEQKTRDEKCGAAARPDQGIDAKGAIQNSPIAIGIGAAAIAGLAIWAWWPCDDPISPYKPGW